MLAGGIGGTTGDILMHSLDTVKTRQQGDPHFPPKYSSLSDSYIKIFRQEGFRRGLYGGFTAAMVGSFPGTVAFFGCYEYCKRSLLDKGISPSAAFLASGKCITLTMTNVHALTTIPRVPRRPSCLDHLRAFRGDENSTTTTGPI